MNFDVNLIGKRVSLSSKEHSYNGKSGIVTSFEKFVGFGQGYKVDLDDGTNTVVFHRENLKLEEKKG